LPRLVNFLRSEMSLVGSRAEQVDLSLDRHIRLLAMTILPAIKGRGAY
jgi:lipopolysaccharide/colanic/teichoic acid biosynthesis glycosyltransferase